MGCNRPYNVKVILRDGESVEKLVRRFFKKCKKQEIVREYLDKISYYKSPSRKKRDKIQKNKRLRRIEELKMQKNFDKR